MQYVYLILIPKRYAGQWNANKKSVSHGTCWAETGFNMSRQPAPCNVTRRK